MSLDIASDCVCYVHCNFCNTILVVSVPCTNIVTAMSVRCGRCANLLSLNTGALLQTAQLHNVHKQNLFCQEFRENSQSAKRHKVSALDTPGNEQLRTLPIHAMGKKQRAPSAYNRFIKEEIRRLKTSNPDISHREAFSTAAKNWAHLPHTQFGLTLNGSMHG